jgi:7-cyano-7-deazaguanine synthase
MLFFLESTPLIFHLILTAPAIFTCYAKRNKSFKNKITIHAPIEHFSKAQIIKMGMKLKVPYEKTWTCYSGTKKPCGICDSCKLRAKGFEEVGIDDPALQ